MGSEYCLTCGHTKNSHVFVEEQHVLKDGEKSNNIVWKYYFYSFYFSYFLNLIMYNFHSLSDHFQL